jgi:hypothetical protein
MSAVGGGTQHARSFVEVDGQVGKAILGKAFGRRRDPGRAVNFPDAG